MITQQNWLNYLIYQREEREDMYNSYKQPEPVQERPRQIDVESQVRICMQEASLYMRLSMLKELSEKVPGASVPYIQLLIRKTSSKISDQIMQPSSLPF
jgi:hypothetical protein